MLDSYFFKLVLKVAGLGHCSDVVSATNKISINVKMGCGRETEAQLFLLIQAVFEGLDAGEVEVGEVNTTVDQMVVEGVSRLLTVVEKHNFVGADNLAQ